MVVLDGLTNRQWKPNRFGGGRQGKERSARAKARLAETPFSEKGWRMPDSWKEYDEGFEAPYLKTSVTRDQAMAIVEKKAKAQGQLNRYTTVKYRSGNVVSLTRKRKPKGFQGRPMPCDSCKNDSAEGPLSVCFNCGHLLCKGCRAKFFPVDGRGEYKKCGKCPGCLKGAQKSLDKDRLKNYKALERLVEAGATKQDPRCAQWLVHLSTGYLGYDNRHLKKEYFQKAKKILHRAGELGLADGYMRLAACYEQERSFDAAKDFFRKAGDLGMGKAYLCLAELYIGEQNWDEAKRAYHKAAELNQSYAVFTLASEAHLGHFGFLSAVGGVGMKEDTHGPDLRSITLLKQARYGSEAACQKFGYMHLHRLEKNPARAFYWFIKQADKIRKDAPARCYLAYVIIVVRA